MRQYYADNIISYDKLHVIGKMYIALLDVEKYYIFLVSKSIIVKIGKNIPYLI